jgi:hypothetical protein
MPVRLPRFALFAALLALLVTSLPAFTATAQDQTASLLDLLPAAGEIGPAFVVIDSHARTLDEQATGFANAGDAARVLGGWQWRENVFQVFQSSELTDSGAPMATLDISLTRFADSEGAAAALPYFLRDRVAVLGQRELPSANQTAIGDEARVIDGFVPGGFDSTLYVRSGPLLLRISATAASDPPAIAPERIARGIIDRAAALQPVEVIAQPATTALPETLPLDDAASFRIAGEGDLDLAGVISRLAGGSDASRALDALGWQGGSYRQFAGDPPAGRAGWIDVSVNQFRDQAAASEAVTLFVDLRQRGMGLQPATAGAVGDRAAALGGPAVNGTEYTLYVSSGSRLFAITGVAPAGDPRPDVEAIAAMLLAPGAPVQIGEQQTPTPYPLAETSPAPVVPTSTPLPAPTPIPTAPPLPTATFAPVPTAIPTATSTPAPAPPPPTEVPPLIPVAIPTAVPTAVPATTPATLPTATAGPLPTPTPRVIRPPTPAP